MYFDESNGIVRLHDESRRNYVQINYVNRKLTELDTTTE